MGDIQTLAHSRKIGVIYFQNVAQKDLRQKKLRYVNELLCEMVKTSLKDTYLGGTTPTELQN